MTASPRFLLALGLLAASLGWTDVPRLQGQDLVRPDDAVAALEQAQNLMGEENYSGAVDAANQAIQLDGTGTYAEAFHVMGDAYRALEDYSSAMQAYTSAINSRDDSATVLNGRGICYRELGQIDLALNDFQGAYNKDHKNAEIAANLGDLYVNSYPDFNAAITVLDKAAELDPTNVEVFRNRGLAHAQLGHFDEAEADLAKAIELKDDDFENYSTLANIYIAQKDVEKLPEGIDALSKAIQYYTPEESTDPDTYLQGYLIRSDARMRLAADRGTSPEEREKLYAEVLEDSEAVLEEMPDTYPYSGMALFNRGLALRMQGSYGKAIVALTKAIQEIPAGESAGYISQAYLKRGICYYMQGENDLAKGDFQQAASLEYTDPLPHLWIGFCKAEDEDFRGAIDSYGEAISKAPNFAMPYLNRGLAYVQLEEFNRALDSFNDAIRIEPSNPDLHAKRGFVYKLMEEYEKAFNAFVIVDELNSEEGKPTDPEVLRAAAECLRKLGRDHLAEQWEARVVTSASSGN